MTTFETKISALMAKSLGPGDLSHLERLSGGASMESWSFDWNDTGYVLRRAPSAEHMFERPLSHADEADLVIAARNAGVKAPEVIAILQDADDLGTGYVMRRVSGEVAPKSIVSDPPPPLLRELGRELALIHALPKAVLPDEIPRRSAAEAVQETKDKFEDFGGDRPIIALALKWCEDNLPGNAEEVLVHGDFRIGNFIVNRDSDDDAVAAILDWELAHWGDSHEDLAFGCMTVWRFGQLSKPAFGLGELHELFEAYEHAGGTKVDRKRFRFWLVYRTVWWAVGCLQMGVAWRSGSDRTVERVVIGRRVAEQELDLIALLENEAPLAERNRPLPPASSRKEMPVGEPTNSEIVQAVREWITDKIKPFSQGHAKFETVVALNALGIVGRDLDTETQAEDTTLAKSIADGTVTLADPNVLARLRRAALERCAVDSPKYAALEAARAAWND